MDTSSINGLVIDPKDRERFTDQYGHPPEMSEEELVDWITKLWHEQDPAMLGRFQDWSYKIQFAMGRQWLHSTDGLGWFEPPVPVGTVRVTNNLTWRAAEYRISKLTESRPIPKVLPDSNEVADADKAEAAQQLLLHLDRALRLGLTYDQLLWYDTLCGCAFAFVPWETQTGEFVAAKRARIVVNEESGEQVPEEYFIDAQGNPVDEEEAYAYRTGNPDVVVIPPWGVRVSNPQEPDPRKQFRWIWGSVMEVSEIKRQFGPVADKISGGGEYEQFVYFEDLITGWTTHGYQKRPTDRVRVPRALVLRFFERPSLEFPRGRYAVVCESTLLHYEEELPYGDPEIGYNIPIVQLRTAHKPLDFYGMATIEPWIPVQKRINQLESHAVEYIRLFSKGGLAAEMGTLIEESWNDSYGSIVYYQGERPVPLSWPSMPSDVLQALSRAYENFDRISGWAEVARGDVPPGVKAARAILELKRSNDTPLGKALQRFDEFIEDLSTQLINRARWGYTEPHWIQVIGGDSPHISRALISDSLPTRFSVKIETDSLLRLSYPAKLELLFELADREWIEPAEAKRMLNFADWDKQAGQWHRDYARARTKIDAILQGQPVTVEFWEDDQVAMLAIAERLKDPRSDDMEPNARMQLSQLWQAHYIQWSAKQQGIVPPQMQSMMLQMFPPPPMPPAEEAPPPEGTGQPPQ